MAGFAVGTYVGPAGIRRLSYEEGLEKLKGKDQKKLENNTWLVKLNKTTLGVKLHDTVVVYIFKSGVYQLNTGGWQTATTKDRINRYGPATVFQKNNIWYVGDGIFEDGVRVNAEGKVLTPQRGTKEVEAKKRKLDRMVRKYIKLFIDHVIRNGLQVDKADNPTEQSPWKVVELTEGPKPLAPSPGDCWSCHFGVTSDDPLKEPLGVEHLLNHMLEEYFVPSLLWKAIVVSGYQNPGFVWRHISNDVRRGERRFIDRVLTAYFRKRKPAILDLME